MTDTDAMKKYSIEIKPPKGLVGVDFRELWRYRDLLRALVERNIKVRYKQTIIGVGWAIFQPLTTMIIFTIFFGRLAGMPSDGIPYPIFVYAGLLYWTFFSTALSGASNSMIENTNMIQKIYFPRLLAPLSAILTPAIDFAVALLILFVLMAYYHYAPNLVGLLLIPVLVICTVLAMLGVGLLFAALNVKYRDVRYVLPFFIQMFMFITPVIYPVSIIPEKFRWIAALNPMSGVITVSRSTLLGDGSIDWLSLLISVSVGIALLIIGLAYFKKTERFFADVI
ncbi:MAG: ABC transporter permease [Patescibacteria group bacterium]